MAASMLLTDSPPRALNDTIFEADPEEVQQQGAGSGEHLHATPSPSPSQETHAKWVGRRLEARRAAAKAANPNPDPTPTSPTGSVSVLSGSGSVSSHPRHDATASPTSMLTHPASPAASLTDIEDLFQGTVEYDVPTFAEILLTLQASAPMTPKSQQSAGSFSAGDTKDDDPETSTSRTFQVVTEFEAALSTSVTLAEAVRMTIPLPLQCELGRPTSARTLHALKHLLSPAQCEQIQKLWADASARELREQQRVALQQVPTQAHTPPNATQHPPSLRKVQGGPLRVLSHNATATHRTADTFAPRSLFKLTLLTNVAG